jgi:hypothetical protein
MERLSIEEQIGGREGVAWGRVYSTIESEYSQVIQARQKPENPRKPTQIYTNKKSVFTENVCELSTQLGTQLLSYRTQMLDSWVNSDFDLRHLYLRTRWQPV